MHGGLVSGVVLVDRALLHRRDDLLDQGLLARRWDLYVRSGSRRDGPQGLWRFACVAHDPVSSHRDGTRSYGARRECFTDHASDVHGAAIEGCSTSGEPSMAALFGVAGMTLSACFDECYSCPRMRLKRLAYGDKS